MNRAQAVGLALGVVAVVAVAVFGVARFLDDEPYTYAAIQIESPQAMPDIRLTTASGQSWALSESDAEVTAVYFGYTHCPDVCPLTMSELAAARDAMPEDRQAEFQVVMVTVDPARDTPEVMDTYVHHFDDSFIGLSGTEDEVAGVMQGWGILAQREDVEGSASYFMSHPAGVNVVDADGRIRLLIPIGVDPKAIASDILHLMDAG
ncbi:MAG: SCO family protein [Dehalococcoidia bacterium]